MMLIMVYILHNEKITRAIIVYITVYIDDHMALCLGTITRL